MVDEFDPYVTTTGLFSDYEGTVEECYFAPNEQGALTVRFKMQTDDPSVTEWEEFYGCGAEWGSYDGGETAEHPKGPDKAFNKNSGYGKFLVAVGETGAVPELKKAGRLDPRQGKNWLGTKWKMESKTETFNDRTTGEKREWTKNYPVKFLGISGQVTNGSSGAPTGVATASASATQIPVALTNLAPETQQQMKALAQDNDWQTWMDKVMEIPGVVSDTEVVKAIADETVYLAVKGS